MLMKTPLTLKSIRPVHAVLSILLIAGAVLSGCATKPEAQPAAADPKATGSAAEKKPVAVTQVTNWFAQPEHGGNYAALAKGYYKEAGLDMTIQAGGPGISATQIVASGKAQFGMGQADEILFARQNGIPLVAVMAIFQKNPQGIMVHKSASIKSMSDLNGKKVYVGSGVAYWEYMKKAFKLDKVEELKYTGQLANFVNDKMSATQCYITSEPYSMKEQGVDVEVMLNADFGYSPYGNIMFTTESFLKENPEAVKAFVEATIKGWDYYKDNYKEINPLIKEKNPDTPLEKMEYSATTLQPLVYGEDAATKGVGYMTKDRWDTLNKQLVDLGLLKSPIDVTKAFTTDFLPKK
ncbi:myristoyl transferase [Paenibacillus sp. H1-7]|nr:myristoyl transferase [Paenibacillus sp. H1-7]